VNIFSYAYPDRLGDVAIVCRPGEAGSLLVEIADDGIPFNILTRDEPNLDTGIEERRIGGLGIFFVRQLVRRSATAGRERNILTLTFDPSPSVAVRAFKAVVR